MMTAAPLGFPTALNSVNVGFDTLRTARCPPSLACQISVFGPPVGGNAIVLGCAGAANCTNPMSRGAAFETALKPSAAVTTATIKLAVPSL